MIIAFLMTMLLAPSYAWEPEKNKPIKLVMATTPGSSSDVVTRAIGKALTDHGYTVIYEYRTGVGGILAANHVHQSDKNGYTLLSVLATGMFVTPELYYPGVKKYDWEKFELISILSNNPSILLGRSSTEIDTVEKIVTSMRSSSPEKYSFGHGPGGGLAQVENFLSAVNPNNNKSIIRIPYKGPSEAALDVAVGELDYAVVVMPSPMGLIKADKLKPIAVTSSKRLAGLPNIPTVSETISGYRFTGINGIALPEGTSKEIVNFYVKFFTTFMKGKEYQTILENSFLTLDLEDMGPLAFKNAVTLSIDSTLATLVKAHEEKTKKND